MYDAHHRRLARLYLITVVFFFVAFGSLAYLAPARTSHELAARLGGGSLPRTALSPEDLATLHTLSVVRVSSSLAGEVRFPAVEVSADDADIAIIFTDEQSLELDDYVLYGTGVFIADGGYIATNAHVVSPEWLYADIYYGLVEEALFSESDRLFEVGDISRAAALEDAYIAGEFDDAINASFDIFRARIAPEVTHEIRIVGASSIEAVDAGAIADIVAEYPRAFITEKDVAIVRISGYEHSVAPLFASARPLPVGSRVYTVGFPQTAEISIASENDATFGAGVVAAYKQINDEVYVYQTDVRASVQSSGSPLFNEQGEVIGLLTISTSDLTSLGLGDSFVFAVPAHLIADLARERDIPLINSYASERVHAAVSALSRGDCAKAERMLDALGGGGPYLETTALDDRAVACVEAAGTSLGIARVRERLATIDPGVLLVFGVLGAFMFALLLMLLYLRSRLAAEEREMDSLKRFVRGIREG